MRGLEIRQQQQCRCRFGRTASRTPKYDGCDTKKLNQVVHCNINKVEGTALFSLVPAKEISGTDKGYPSC